MRSGYTFFQVWIDVFEGRAYATRYDTDDPYFISMEDMDRRYSCHPSEFRIVTEDPEEAKRQAWARFKGMRAVSGIIRAILRRWLWNEGKVARWLIRKGIFQKPPCSGGPETSLWRI
jgi:hypothetical protein